MLETRVLRVQVQINNLKTYQDFLYKGSKELSAVMYKVIWDFRWRPRGFSKGKNTGAETSRVFGKQQRVLFAVEKELDLSLKSRAGQDPEQIRREIQNSFYCESPELADKELGNRGLAFKRKMVWNKIWLNKFKRLTGLIYLFMNQTAFSPADRKGLCGI